MKRQCFVMLLAALIFCGSGQTVQAATYSVDPTHSTVGFSAKHLMVSEVKGSFSDYKGTINFDPANLALSNAEMTIQAASISTANEKRDAHLKTADFFDTEKYPTLSFKSKEIKKQGDQYTMTGDLNIHGVTKTIDLPCSINGPITNPMGGDQVIGLSCQTTINRQDYGVSWSKQMDQGGFVVDNNVLIDINLEAHEQK